MSLDAMTTFTTPMVPAQPAQLSDTETYSDNILGPVAFRMSKLNIAGSNTRPAAPAQSPYIISSSETFEISVDIEFNKTPLTALLMCLGTRVKVDFAFEGYGGVATEKDLYGSIKTVKGQYKYTVKLDAVPSAAGLVPGLYSVAAVADIGPVENECSTCIFGHGYIERILVEVYPSGEECYG